MPRRGENIYKRKDGRWEGRYQNGYDVNGKVIYKSLYAHSYTEIKEKLRNRKTGLVLSENDMRLLSDHALQWLENVEISRKLSTYSKYKNIYFLHIDPIIGSCRTDLINSRHIEKILENISDLSPKTQNDIICVVKIIFDHVTQNGGKINLSMKGCNVRQEYKDMRVLSADEQKAFTDILLKDTDQCKMGIYLSLCTGIRIGELCALKREDICTDTKVLRISKTLQRVQVEGKKSKTEVIITEPKSKHSVREIPLHEFLADLCKKIYGGLQPADYLLTGRSTYMEPRALQYHFKKYINECGLADVNFHALRHTFATRCVENGFEIKTLSEILGHVNVNITLNRYVHSSMELKRANMEKINSVF